MGLDFKEEKLVTRIAVAQERSADALERLSLTAAHIRGVLAIIASRLGGAGLTPEQEQVERELATTLGNELRASRQSLEAALAAAKNQP